VPKRPKSEPSNAKQIVQVPMSAQFVAEVDRLAQARGESRAAFVRRACEQFMRDLREQAMEAAYEQGYRDHPEALGFAEAAARVSAASWPEDDWSAHAPSDVDDDAETA